VRVDVEHVPGGSTLTGRPGRYGYADVARCSTRAEALVNLLMRALSVAVASYPGPRS
jgi:hypothetical protein